jgi:hypothetical protein
MELQRTRRTTAGYDRYDGAKLNRPEKFVKRRAKVVRITAA